MGVDVELVEGVGPVVARADPHRRPTSSGCGCPTRRRRSRRSSRRSRIVRARARARAGGRRLLRRPVHRRRLPRRGPAVARLRGDEGADVPRAARLARAAGEARRHVRRATWSRRRGPAPTSIQLFDSWVGALSPADYEEFVAPWSARILARSRCGVPTIHFGTGTATLLASMAARGRRRDRPRLADPARRGLGARRRGSRRAGKPRPGACCSARGSASRRRRATSSRAPAAGRATSSISATACCPAPTRTCSAACASSSTHETAREKSHAFGTPV